MKKLIVSVLILGLVSAGYGQGILTINESTFSFGEIKEENGQAEHTFVLVNTGNKPITLAKVEAECGCTTPEWTAGPILPGDTGYVVALYNPLNRPGPFQKKLTISSDAKNDPATLYIEGVVLPKPKSIQEELPAKIGSLRLRYKSLNFGKVTTEKQITRRFDVYNEGDSTIRLIQGKSGLPKHLQAKFEPEALQPGQPGELVISYDPKNVSLGFTNHGISLKTNDPEEPVKELSVVATVEEHFPPMTPEELANAPKLAFDKTSHDFGRVDQNISTETVFVLSNIGKSLLNIRDIQTNCDCVETSVSKSDLKPGETVILSVRFESELRKGRQYKTVSIFSNDPSRPTQMISIRAEVE